MLPSVNWIESYSILLHFIEIYYMFNFCFKFEICYFVLLIVVKFVISLKKKKLITFVEILWVLSEFAEAVVYCSLKCLFGI